MTGDAKVPAIRWRGGADGVLELIDQTRLPGACVVLELSDLEGVRDAICRLAVRGAPAIGVAAGFGLWLGVRGAPDEPAAFGEALARAKARLASARPTAANLVWALDRIDAASSLGPPGRSSDSQFVSAGQTERRPPASLSGPPGRSSDSPFVSADPTERRPPAGLSGPPGRSSDSHFVSADPTERRPPAGLSGPPALADPTERRPPAGLSGPPASAGSSGTRVSDRKRLVFEAANALLDDDVKTCAKMGEHGAALLGDGDRVLTYCNTGALATAGMGTALAVVFEAKRQGKKVSVVSCETRPLLQGARLTMWELMREGIEATLITDNAAATVMKQKKVDRVLVGADRIARNGDAANKIGTYGVALLAKAHGIPFHVVAPRSTFDPTIASGDQIPIEERAASEITEIGGIRIAPEGARVFAPAFDVTPAALITGIVTEAGVISPVSESAVMRTLLDRRL